MVKNVLVGVLKRRIDLDILLKDHWYRIPVAFSFKRKFDYIAFYQPSLFGKRGKRIEFYARISKKRKVKRKYLLPNEGGHPSAECKYYKYEFKKIIKLARPIKNIVPRRVSFGFTELKTLLSARNILQLYGVPDTESILERALHRAGIKTKREFSVSVKGKRFRIDLVVLQRSVKIAIEIGLAAIVTPGLSGGSGGIEIGLASA